MDTTFSALSTALSRCSTTHDYKESGVTTRAYLAILLGPSREYAKSKVILGIDGLEKRIWGDVFSSSSSDDENEARDLDSVSETENDEGAEVPDDSESEEEEESEDDSDENVGRVSSSPPPTQNSHASEQRFLQNAVGLLCRTLAAAEADGRGIISENTFSFVLRGGSDILLGYHVKRCQDHLTRRYVISWIVLLHRWILILPRKKIVLKGCG